MKIVIINPCGRLCVDGSRLISALLKRDGHSVKTVFLPRLLPLEYKQSELEHLDEIVKDGEVVMVAVWAAFAIRAIQVTNYIHKKYPGRPVIWGGPFCINAPELSLQHADGVCFSEGEEAVVEFVNKLESGADYTNTPNMAFNVNGSQVVNRILPLFSDLDSLPYPDFNMDDHYVLDGELTRMTREKMIKYFVTFAPHQPVLFILTTRGCPHQCSYCNNTRYIAMYGRNRIRFRSVDHFLDEMEQTLTYLDFFNYVAFGDDDFLIRPIEQIEDFAEKYKKRIGLPFGIATNPNTFRKEKFEILLDAGLKAVQIGVQSGSQRLLDEVYNRKTPCVAKTKEIVRQIEPYQKSHDCLLIIDFIIDNPYETRDDIIQSYNYIIDVYPEAMIQISYLSFFPGTPIYERALNDGLIKPFSDETYRYLIKRIVFQKNYETLLVILSQFGRVRRLPKFILNALGSRPVRTAASVIPQLFYGYIINTLLPKSLALYGKIRSIF